jgi:hypothetical protein
VKSRFRSYGAWRDGTWRARALETHDRTPAGMIARHGLGVWGTVFDAAAGSVGQGEVWSSTRMMTIGLQPLIAFGLTGPNLIWFSRPSPSREDLDSWAAADLLADKLLQAYGLQSRALASLTANLSRAFAILQAPVNIPGYGCCRCVLSERSRLQSSMHSFRVVPSMRSRRKLATKRSARAVETIKAVW